jgi:hypothetical protein
MLATLHPCGDELELYLRNRLPVYKSVRIAEHLRLCAPCVERSAELEESINCVWQYVSSVRPSGMPAIRHPAMPAIRHPADDELERYLLNRLPAHESVTLAQHLLWCPSCVERSALLDDQINSPRHGSPRQDSRRLQRSEGAERSTALCVQRILPASRNRTPVWRAGYAIAAALLLTTGLGTVLFQRTSVPRPREAASATPAPVFSAPPASGPAEPVQTAAADPVARKGKRAAASAKPKPQRRIPRHFVPPPAPSRTHEPAYLMPASRPVLSSASIITAGFGRLPTDIGQLPGRPVKKSKRNPFFRFLAVFAKPFRSDRT